MEDVEQWAENARQQGYIVQGSGWHRYKVRKDANGKNVTRAEAKLRLIAEHGEFLPTTPKHRYIHFAGDKRTVKHLKKALKLPELSYPKRKSQVSARAPDLA